MALFQTWRIKEKTAANFLSYGDVIIVVPYFAVVQNEPFGLSGAPRIGDVVLVTDGSEHIVPLLDKILDSIVRFFTLQRCSFLEMSYGADFGQASCIRLQTVSQENPKRIIGKVVFRVWPFGSIGKVQ